jgi:O-antigen/teichoic acid export membrane protein
MRFLRDSSVTLFASAGTFVVGAVTSVIVARALGPEGKGVFTLVFLLPALLASLGSFGLSAANVFFLRRGQAAAGTLLSNGILFALAISLAVSAILALGWRWIAPAILPGVSPGLAAIGILTLPLALLMDYALSLLLGYQRLLRFNVAGFGAAAISLVFLAAALLLLRPDPAEAAVAKLLATIVSAAVVLLALRGAAGRERFQLRPRLEVLRRSLSYGAREHLGNVAMFLAYRVDLFFVAAFAGAKAVGIYSIAVMLAEVFFYLPNAISTVLFPRLAGSDLSRSGIEAARATRVTSFVVGAGALVSIPLVAPIIGFAFSSAFLPAAPAYLALLPGIYALCLSKVLSPYFTGAMGKPGLAARAAIIAVAVNVPLNVLLIPSFGIVGAAVASSIAYAVHAVLLVRLFMRHAGISLGSILVPRSEDLRWIVANVRGLAAARGRASAAAPGPKAGPLSLRPVEQADTAA